MLRLVACLALFSAVSLPAQQSPASAPYDHNRDAPVAAAVRTSSAVRIDGLLDEAAWRGAAPVTDFRQLDPREGSPVSERTEVRILYDEDALYIGAMLYDRQAVTSRLGRRDMGMSASDWLTVILDSNHDHRTAFGFEVNPSGVRRDQTRTGSSEDDSWEPVWQAATSVTDSGWVAELRIPFSQLRFSRGQAAQTWGVQIERQIARNQEFALWPFTPRDQPAGIPRFAHLSGLEGLTTGKRVEMLPYAVTRAEYIDRSGNPFRTNREFSGDLGLDLKYRVTSNLTLDATVNPDFGQVEVDPAVINLTAFETIFQEKRPFFIESSELFRFGEDGSNSVFYSRRIGRRPSVAPPSPTRDMPDETRILAAAKLTGRSGGGWATGVLNALTARESARFIAPDGSTAEAVAEPLTNYFVGRVRREARAGQTALGGFLGAVNRDLESDPLRAALRSAAYTLGTDLFHQWAQRTWTLQGYVVGSHVRGTRAVMTATQRLPYHYFQRPDADHLELAPDATSMSGFAGRMALSKRVGRHWSGSASVNTISPGYEVSDLGFQRRADRIDVQGNLNYQETRPGRFLRRYSLGVSPLVEHNYGGDNISNRLFINGSLQTVNYLNAFSQVTFSKGGTVDDRLTRGGPAASRAGYVSVYSELGTDNRKALVAVAGAYLEAGDGGSTAQPFVNVRIKPAPQWELSLGPGYAHTFAEAQYLRRVEDASATRTYGARYVFAGLEQKVFSLDTRLNYTFTPQLSLQVYAQPFIAAGDFGAPKEFAAPRTFDFLVYGRDIGEVAGDTIFPAGRGEGAVSFVVPNPDFSVRSLRGNAVLRWEWRPGSTMYLAWQQTRQAFAPLGDFALRRDLDSIFAASPDNVLLLKVSYWLNP